jgi:uncharacterized protein (DUF2336 family)
MPPKHLTDGLADLARANQQTRDAALLRATTELFVRDARHDRDQIRRYEELATHLLPKVTVNDRAFIAERLAACVEAPKAVIRLLARDQVDVAAPILRGRSTLDQIDLLTIIAGTRTDHHRIIARRPGLADQVKQALRLTGDPEVLALINGESPPSAGKSVETAADKANRVASIAAARHASASSAPEHRAPSQFLQLDRPARLRVLADFATRPPARRPSASATRLDRAFRSILGAAKIVGHARSGQVDALITAIAEGLDLESGFVTACLSDATGEALAVLLKALHLDDVQAQQVFLLATPAGRDTARFFPLADLYAGMEASTAEAICDQWRAAAEMRSVRHEPFLADDAGGRRDAAAETHSQRTPAVREQSRRA